MDNGSMSAVYFRRLGRDAYKPKARPKLLDTLKTANDNYVQLSAETHGFGGGSHILQLANAEAAKEQEMLSQIFGEHLNLDLSQPGAIKQLTEAINTAFEFRAIYERNRDIIMSEEFNGQKGVFSYFNTYFMQAYKRAQGTLKREIGAKMLANPSLKAGDAALQVFEAATPRLIDNAVKRMFGNADVELKNSMDEQHKNAYKEIIAFISRFPNQNMFTEGLARAWNLDEVKNEFAKAFSNQRRTPKKATMNRALSNVQTEISKSMHSKGGISVEVVIDQCIAMMAQKLSSTSNVTVGHYKGAGAVDARADNVFYFNMNGALVDRAFENVEEKNSTREAAVEEFSRLGKELSEVKDGFIVYVNDKNYTLNDNFKRRGGMSAGTAWTLNQVQGLLGGIVGDIDQLIYNILQTGKDAIRAGDTGDASRVLAEGIAYYLFDDYNTIGNPGGNAIHVMGLQGMLIPLSAFLFALGTALNTVESNPTSYVKVSITPGPTDASNENSYGMDNWDSQYNTSMDKTKIAIHFAANFVDFVRGNL